MEENSNIVTSSISIDDVVSQLGTLTTTTADLKLDDSYIRSGYLATYTSNLTLNQEGMKKFGLEEDKEISLKDIKGWSFFGESDEITGLWNINKSFCFKTNIDKGWLCEFKILISVQGNKMLYFVSPECLDYYFIEENELLEALKESIKIETSTANWINDAITEPYYTSSPNTWSSSITCDSSSSITLGTASNAIVYNPNKCYVTATSIC